jgi:hypothetical protein
VYKYLIYLGGSLNGQCCQEAAQEDQETQIPQDAEKDETQEQVVPHLFFIDT